VQLPPEGKTPETFFQLSTHVKEAHHTLEQQSLTSSMPAIPIPDSTVNRGFISAFNQARQAPS
jgi:hypothetical protein